MSLNQKTPEEHTKRGTKKDQIISFYLSGLNEIEEIAKVAEAHPSYVAAVLQDAGFVKGYFDLYTTTGQSMNVYSKAFARKLGFKTEEAARQSVSVIDKAYERFALRGDRAGQHHALVMALTMFNRARWTGKGREAEFFRNWLMNRLEDAAWSSDLLPDSLEE